MIPPPMPVHGWGTCQAKKDILLWVTYLKVIYNVDFWTYISNSIDTTLEIMEGRIFGSCHLKLEFLVADDGAVNNLEWYF